MFGLSNHTKQGLRILIIGCGKVGQILTNYLAGEEHDVVVIDINEDKIEDAEKEFILSSVAANFSAGTISRNFAITICQNFL